MASILDATVLIFDVGSNATERESDDKPTFFERGKKCLEAIITRKLFTKPKDELSLLLMGTSTTDNDLNRQYKGYEHISQGFPMNTINWDMLNYVSNSIDPPNDKVTADWIDAIFVAMDYLKTLEIPKASKKIVLLTNFSTHIAAENVDDIVGGLEQEKIELIVITTDVIYEKDENTRIEYAKFSQMSQKSKERKTGEQLIKEIVGNSNGILCSFDEAMSKLIYLDKRHRRRVPWNADFTIGTKLTIKVAAFIYVRDEKELGTWQIRTLDSQKCSDKLEKCNFNEVMELPKSTSLEKCSTKTEYYHNDEQVTSETIVEELIKGYPYGGTVIPFEDADEFETGGKGLRCIGFTNAATIRDEYLAGSGIWVVGPQKGSQVASKMLTALSKTMHKLNLLMVARYTYGNKTAPKMMVLFPNTMTPKSCEHNSLLMYELFYKDSFVDIAFPPLQSKKTAPSAEQCEIMDEFIDSMDLMIGNDSKVAEHFDSDAEKTSSEFFKKLLDPGLQHMYRAIAHRALNPNDPVLKADKDILDMITPPKEKDAQAIVEKMKTLFPLEAVKMSNKEQFMERLRNWNDDQAPMPLNDGSDIYDSNGGRAIVEVGTIDPADDFIELYRRGERFDNLAPQIQKAIVEIVLKSIVLLEEKVIKAIFAYREVAKEKAPYKYNEWIKCFKETLEQNGKVTLWIKLVANEQLGLITETESELSTVTETEAKKFLSMELTSDVTKDHAMENDNDCLDDMFEEM